MAGRKREVTVVATHRYVRDPEAVERAIDMWARYLASNAVDIHRGRLDPSGRSRSQQHDIQR